MATIDLEQRPRNTYDAEKKRTLNKACYAANKETLAAKKKAYRAANKETIAAKKKAYRAANKEAIAAHKKACYAANKETLAAKMKVYEAANKETIAAKKKAYRAANKEAIAAQKKACYAANKETLAAKMKAYRAANKETIAAKKKAYRAANKEAIAAQKKAYRAANKETLATKMKVHEAANNFRAQTSVGAGASTGAAALDSERSDDDAHPLAATTKKVVMVTFTNEHPFNLRKRGPEPCCDECAKFKPNALTSATNTVLLAGTYQCTFCRDWTYYKLHRKHKRTRADARLDALSV